MGEIKQFKLKEKQPTKVLEHGECGGQLWYVEENPAGENQAALHRCFKCGMVVDVYDLFYSAEDDK